MRNHHEKAKDMAESVLPSTGRAGAAKARRRIHHRGRARARAALVRYLADPEGGDEHADAHVAERRYRLEITEFVSDRRAQDKVGSLCRWAVRRLATRSELADLDVEDQVESLRRIFPDSLIGRHAVSHVEWAVKWDRIVRDRAGRPVLPSYRELRVAFLREQLRVVLEVGGHGALNRAIKAVQAGSDQPPRVLLGAHDVNAFAEHSAGRPAFEEAIAKLAVTAESC